jgi:hypothetical protein
MKSRWKKFEFYEHINWAWDVELMKLRDKPRMIFQVSMGKFSYENSIVVL